MRPFAKLLWVTSTTCSHPVILLTFVQIKDLSLYRNRTVNASHVITSCISYAYLNFTMSIKSSLAVFSLRTAVESATYKLPSAAEASDTGDTR